MDALGVLALIFFIIALVSFAIFIYALVTESQKSNNPPAQPPQPVKPTIIETPKLEPLRIIEVKYNLVSEFNRHLKYHSAVQTVLELELIRLCNVAKIEAQRNSGLRPSISVKNNRNEIQTFDLAADYQKGFGECFIYMSQILNDKTPFKNIPVYMVQIGNDINYPEKVLIDVLRKEMGPETMKEYSKTALWIFIGGRSVLANYISKEPTFLNFFRIYIKFEDIEKDTIVDLNEYIGKPMSEIKNNLGDIFDGSIFNDLRRKFKDNYPNQREYTNSDGTPLTSSATATSQGMNGFKEEVRKYR